MAWQRGCPGLASTAYLPEELRKAVIQRCRRELWKCFDAVCNVEALVRYKATLRKVFDPHIRAAEMGNLGGNFTEGVRCATHGIESAFTAMSEAKPN